MVQDNPVETVADYMTTKMVTTSEKDSVLQIARIMADRGISSVAITNDGKRIRGILTERDIISAIAKGIPPDGVTSGSLMSQPVVAIDKGASVEDAARIMAQKKLRHLLVEDAVTREIVGIITVTDLARYLKRSLTETATYTSQTQGTIA